MIGALGRWWRKRQRQLDIEMLWPAIRRRPCSLYVARAAFRQHVIYDPAWTKDLDLVQIEEIVGRLT